MEPIEQASSYHLQPGWRVRSCEIQKAGVVRRGEERLEYQVLKVFFEELPPRVDLEENP